MKKLFTLLMTLVLFFSVSDVALADQAKITVSGKESVKRGQEVEYTVSMADCDKANTLGIEISYDKNVFTMVTNKCGWVNEGKVQDFDAVKNKGVWTVETAKDLNGDIFKLAFTVNGNAKIDKTDVKVTVIAKNDADVVLDKHTETITVKVVCDHVFGDWANKDANNHAHVCKNCQTEVTEAHKWSGNTCTVCKATKTDSEGESGTTTPDSGTTTPGTDDSTQGGTTTPGTDNSNQGGTTTKPDSSTTKPGTTTPDNSTQGDASISDTEDVTADDTQEPETEDVSVEEDTEDVSEDVKGDDAKPADGGNAGTIVVVILVIVAIAAGAFFVWKKKR